MCLFQGFNSLVISLELLQLLLVLLNTPVKASLNFFKLTFEICDRRLVLLLYLLLFGQQTFLIFLELLETLLLLFHVLLLECPYLGLPCLAFLCVSEGILLARDDSIGTL